jgi:arylsulfatase A-like enzyme
LYSPQTSGTIAFRHHLRVGAGWPHVEAGEFGARFALDPRPDETLTRQLFFIALLALAFASSAGAKPNLLLILTDDQRFDSMSVMPSTRENFDVPFRSAIVTTPLCCPSRASFLTGEYAHNHGVMTNSGWPIFADLAADSLGPWLQEQGYFTGFVGKYLNRYPLTAPLPAGFDEAHYRVWDENGLALGNGHTEFTLREFWTDGAGAHDEIVTYPNTAAPNAYATRRFGALAARFIQRAHDPAINPEGKPWALLVWPTAPHTPLLVEPRYQDALVPAWRRPPSYLEADMRDKPRVVRQSILRRSASYPFATKRNRTMRMLMSVDDMVERVWNTIDDYDERKNTWGIFSSDNGFFFGEHWLTGKMFAYEESVRVPLRMAVPGIGHQVVDGSLVANIDVAPTLVELAGGAPRDSFDGQSFLPLLADPAECFCGRRVLIENWDVANYQALRMLRWKYIRWPSGAEELYDLRRDPYELVNVARSSRRAALIARLRIDLDGLLLD